MKAARYPDLPQKVDVIHEDGYRVTDKYVLFRLMWIMLTGFALFMFYVLKNNWLEG